MRQPHRGHFPSCEWDEVLARMFCSQECKDHTQAIQETHLPRLPRWLARLIPPGPQS